MGMFDYITFEGHQYQTKDTPEQSIADYEIRGNELWWRKVEFRWEEGDGHPFGGYLEEVSHEWIFCKDFDGCIRFYRAALEDKQESWKQDAWIEYRTLFMDGKMIKCNLFTPLEDRVCDHAEAEEFAKKRNYTYQADDGPLTDDQVKQIKKDVAPKLPTGKLIAKNTLFPDESNTEL
jgi:hypothetical protein